MCSERKATLPDFQMLKGNSVMGPVSLCWAVSKLFLHGLTK